MDWSRCSGRCPTRIPLFHSSRSQSPPSASGVLFVCSSPKCSPGSHQMKSQLARLGREGRCGMCSLAGSCPRLRHGRQEGWCETCCSHTASTGGASLVPWQLPSPAQGSHTARTSRSACGDAHATACVEYSGFGELLSDTQREAAAAVIASDNRCCSSAPNHLEKIHGRGFVPVSLPAVWQQGNLSVVFSIGPLSSPALKCHCMSCSPAWLCCLRCCMGRGLLAEHQPFSDKVCSS